MSHPFRSALAPALVAALLTSPLESAALAQCAQEQGQILASDGAAQDEFGWAVDLAGEVAVVGCWRDNAAANLSGSASILRLDAGIWTEEQKLVPADGQLADFFGWSVAIDGDTAAIGSISDEDAAPDGGSVYVQRFDGASWQLEAELFASDAGEGDHFGVCVALDGDTLLVGADLDNDNGTWSGSAYVFRRTAGVWLETQKLQSSDAASYDHFGYALDLDGDLAVIGAYGADSFQGAAYVFRRNGALWSEEARLVGSQTVGGDFFAASVSVSGQRVLSGARWAEIGNIVDTGEAYVFHRAGGSWIEEQRLTEEAPGGGDGFGFSVDLSGNLALIGVHNRDQFGPHSGEAVLFRLTGDVWIREPRLLPSDPHANDFFGLSVAIDGGAALIGAPGDDDRAEDAGSVYAFDAVGCFDCPPPSTYCVTSPNSVGTGALIGSSGTTSIAANDLFLLASGLPHGQFGIFYYGPNQILQPFGDGVRCVGGVVTRRPPLNSGPTGTVSFHRDHGALSPAGEIEAGDTTNFQFWYRDPAFGGAGFNLSDALEVSFCP